MALRKFALGQRVLVRAVGEYTDMALDPPASGFVVRVRRADDGAWIALDERHRNEAAHPFPADDSRGTHVLAFPENCDPIRVPK